MRRALGPGLGAHLGAFYLFLYLPIAVLVVLSFNRAGLPTVWTGFSTEWYGKLADNQAVLRAALNSLIVAAATTLLATALGTALASASNPAAGLAPCSTG